MPAKHILKEPTARAHSGSPIVAPATTRFFRRLTKLPLSQNTPLSWPGAAQYEAALHALVRELDNAKEQERHRLAEQLHDGLGQELVLTKLKLSELADALPAQYKASLATIAGAVDGLLRQTRSILDDLYAQRACERGLKRAVQAAASELKARHGIACTVAVDSLTGQLDGELQEKLFRAVRELLLNIVKHAGATKANVTMMSKPGLFEVEVSDNGRGFDSRQTVLSELSVGRFGLFSVRASLRALGGTLRIYSRVGRGTRAIMRVPLGAA